MEVNREGRRYRSRSFSEESEEERHRRRRRERDDRGAGRDRDTYNKEVDRRNPEHRHRRDEVESRRRRSRSPISDYSASQHRERSSKHRTHKDYSAEPRRNMDRDVRPQKDDLDRQITAKKDGPLPSQADSFLMAKNPSTALVRADDNPVQEKQKPNYNPTGLLAAASNSVAKADGTSIVLKYHEPPEARKPPPKDQWKLFVFKGADIRETIELSLRSCWLIGREIAVVDLPAEHPSISKQHAVIQFRWIEKRNEFGDKLGRVKPYLIDLESANGTMLNKEPIPSSRYLELRDKDMIQFGDSTREYVLMLPPKD
jgi:smad nuclear-interacting protein 1